uniref:Putative secreted protein n=1 Tax=Ixodes ricinus TaxID=34613 RepID=A0A6B0UHL2_IXORI
MRCCGGGGATLVAGATGVAAAGVEAAAGADGDEGTLSSSWNARPKMRVICRSSRPGSRSSGTWYCERSSSLLEVPGRKGSILGGSVSGRRSHCTSEKNSCCRSWA